MLYDKKYVLLVILGIGFALACKKDSDALADYNRPVVQAYLVPGKMVEVKLYYQKYLEDTISYGYPITGLSLKIADGTRNVDLTETKPGIYTYADLNFVKSQKSYTLTFEFLNKIISATTTVPTKPVNFKASSTQQEVPSFSFGSTPKVFVPVNYSWINTDAGYYMISFQNVEQYPSNISPNTNLNTEALVGQTSSYNTQIGNFNYTGNHKVLLFHINSEYYNALKSSGGNSLNLTNPSTNVINGLGIFTALNADTLNLHVYQ